MFIAHLVTVLWFIWATKYLALYKNYSRVSNHRYLMKFSFTPSCSLYTFRKNIFYTIDHSSVEWKEGKFESSLVLDRIRKDLLPFFHIFTKWKISAGKFTKENYIKLPYILILHEVIKCIVFQNFVHLYFL